MPEPLDEVRVGIVALLQHDLIRAEEAFTNVYQAPEWEWRDIAVTGMGDMVDVRMYENRKLPSVIVAAGWEPEEIPPRSPRALPEDRLLLLVEHSAQRTMVEAQTIEEQKNIHALRSAVASLKRALLNDPHHMVRFSALLMLTFTLGESKRPYIQATLERARQFEKNSLVLGALEDFLNVR